MHVQFITDFNLVVKGDMPTFGIFVVAIEDYICCDNIKVD